MVVYFCDCVFVELFTRIVPRLVVNTETHVILLHNAYRDGGICNCEYTETEIYKTSQCRIHIYIGYSCMTSGKIFYCTTVNLCNTRKSSDWSVQLYHRRIIQPQHIFLRFVRRLPRLAVIYDHIFECLLYSISRKRLHSGSAHED